MKNLLICFDVDGTLIDDTVFIWQTLHDRIGTDPIERKMWTQKYFNKEITYAEWAGKDVEMWMRHHVTHSQLLEYVSELRPMKNCSKVLKYLKSHGHTLGVISGSLDIALEETIEDWQHLFSHVMLNRLQFDSSGYLSGIKPTPFDIEHKATGLLRISELTGIPIKDSVFIGDNFNDVDVAKLAECSIAFNCKSTDLASIADHVVEGPDLMGILPIIDAFAAARCTPQKSVK